jgi:hypothetical protein
MDNPNKKSWETTNQTYLYPTLQLPYCQNSYQKIITNNYIREKIPSAVKARDMCAHRNEKLIQYLCSAY